MNGPFQVAQANVAGQAAGKPPARIVKIAKPFSEQSVIVALSYDGSVKADLSAIAGEKITLVHIGEKLIILFDNKSTVTLEPFFDSTGKPIASLTVEVSPGRDLTGAEFAALFPVTEDQSVLPAAGDGDGNAQASGANFSSTGVDPLALPGPLDLLGQEELPNFVIANLLTPRADFDLIPSQISGARVGGITEEEQLGGIIFEGPASRAQSIKFNQIGSGGKEDPNDVTLPNSDGTGSDGLDQDTPENSFVTTQFFHGAGANALTNLVTSGNPPLTFTIDAGIPNSAVVDGTGAVVKSAGHELHYSAIDTSVAGDNTIVGGYSEGESGFHEVFRLTIHSDGTYDFELIDKIDHPVHTTDTGSTSNGHLEETLFLDFTTLVHVADLDGDQFTLTGTGAFTIGVIDDTPEVSVTVADAEPLFLTSLDESINADIGDSNAAGDDVAGNTVPDPLGVKAIGEVKSADFALADLFSVTGTAGEDGLASVGYAFSLTLSGAGQNGGVATSLSVTDPNHVYGNDSTIYLFSEGGQIVGRVGAADGAIALRISIENPGNPVTAHFVVDQYLPVDHGQDGNNFDSSLPLTLVGEGTLGVTLTTTVTDGDGDVATSAATVTVVDSETTSINIEDDGPTISAGEGGETTPLAVLDLDETIGADRYNTSETESNGGASNGADDKAATVTVSIAPLAAQAIGELSTGAGALAGLFTAANIDFGTDGSAAGGGITNELSLVLSSETVGTNLTATALVGTPLSGMPSGQRAIELVQVNATTIEGRLVGDGIAANGDEYVAFRITLENPNDPATAKITVDQFLAIDHGGSENPSVFDEQTLLTLIGNGKLDLKLVTTVTDGDGDHASLPVQVNLIGNENSFIAFDDDGPQPLSISATNGAANGLFFDGFVPNNDAWGAGSGINNSGAAGAWHISASPYEGASTIQLERVGDNYRGSDSPSNSVMVDLEATPGNVQVSQGLTLTPGALYHLTFEIGAANDPGIAANSAKLEVFWNGNSVGIYTPTSGVMQTISIDVTAAGTNNQLTFREIGEAGDNTGTFLANVKLSDVIIIDETKGVQADSDDTAADLSGLFATVTNGGPVGVDPDMDQPQYAKGLHSVVVLGTANYGTDGAAATNPIQIGLSVSSAGVDSGLTTTEGKAIHLFVEGALVVGRFDSGNDGIYDTAAFALSIDPNGGILSIAQYVSLHHPDTHSNDEGVYLKPGTVLATVTLTDGDGDQRTTSADISSAVRFEDDGPSIDPLQNSSLRDWTIDEDMLPAFGHSTPQGNDSFDNPADTNDYTQINNKPLGVTWGADGPKALTFAATDSHHPTITITDQNGTPYAELKSGGVALVYDITTNADGGQTLIAYKGSVSAANEIFKLTLDPDAGTGGTFSFQLIGALDHPDGAGQNTLNLRFDFTATDGDGDTAASFLTMRITDDVPYLSNQVISRAVDEDDISTPWSHGTSPNDGSADGSTTENSTGAAYISGTLAGLIANGADLPGKFGFASDAREQLLALGLFSKESALGNGENGKPLSYAISNGLPGSNEIIITGNEPNPQGNPVFSLTLNTVTGAYEFRLFDELIHMPGDGQNDDLRSGQPSGSPLVQHSIPYLDLGSIITYTDKDGDTVNLGGKFTVTITDDVPRADIDINRNASITIDESGGNEADNTTSSSVRNLFKSLENSGIVGDDPDVSGDSNGSGVAGNGAIAYAHSNFAIVSDNSTIGSDSPPYPHQYTLSIVGDAASGLFVTDGSPINLSVNADGLVIGTVVGGAFNGKVAFAIAIESDGEVSVAQYLSLKHDDRGDPNETNDNGSSGNDASPNDTPNPVQQNLDGKILVTLTVTDSDGDKSTDTANIGKLITFLDDGPSLRSNATVALEDDDLPGGNEGGPDDDNAPLNASGTLSHDYGADGPGSTLLTGVNLPSGLGFTSSVSSDGLTLIIKQNGVDVLKIELTDSIDGGYKVTQLNAIDHPTLNGQSGDDTENNVEFTVSYRVTDGDGDFVDGSLKINVDDDTPEPNFILQSGKLVVIDETAGLQNATATPGVPGDANDNDTSNPFPVAVTNPGIPAADSTLFGAPQVAQSNGAVVAVTPHYGADGPGSTVFTIDVPGSSTSSGLTTVSGQPITLFEVNANLIVGRYDGPDSGSSVGTNDPAAFAIYINPTTGVISVVQYVAIKHDDRGDFDEDNDDGSNGNDASPNDSPNPVQQSIINSAIRVTVTVTDHDGDSVDATYNIGSKIVFEDDGPTISIIATGEAGVVLTTQDADTIGNASDTAVSAANFSGVFTTTSSYGADGGGSTTLGYSLAVTGTPGAGGRVDSNLDSQGASIYLYNVGGTIVGSTALTAGAIADSNKIFSVSVNNSGVVTLTQFQQIDHPIANDPSASGAPFNDQNAILGNGLISLTRSGSITDGDGDTATASATIDLGGNIQFTDHGPSATTTASLKVDEDDLSAGNHDTTSPGDDMASASLSGTLGFAPGADTPATVSFSPLGGTAVVDAGGHPVTAGGVALTYFWVSATNTLYASTDGTVGGAAFKIQVTNPSTGAYSFSLLGPVDHPGHDADGQNNGPETAYEDNININLTYTVTDFDKDTATGTLSISIDDDMPILPAAPTNLIVNGDFSQGTFASASFGGIATAPGSVTGWVFANSTFEPPSNLQVERVNDGYLGLHTSTHGSMIDMGASPGNIEISQQLSGLTPGQAYAISFEAGAPYPSTAELQVLWNNVVIGTIDPAGPMTSYAYIVNATGIAANDKITFREVGQGHAVIPGQADEGYHGTYLANVSVIATSFVDEDGLASGNHDSQVGDAVVPNTDGDNNEATTTGSLNIQWGADNRDIADATAANSGFVQDGALGAALTGRSVFFTDNSVLVTGASSLKSDGVDVTFVLSNNNTKLQGFAGSREVFEVTLSDDGSGQYRFILKGPLDHALNGNENDIALTFNFTAKDSDGDAVSGRFAVGIDDDVPVITAAADVVTLNEALLPTDGNPGGITQANVGFLHINWGADNGAGKHLAFVKDGNGQVVGPALTSDGVALDYFIRPASDSPGNEQLVAVKHGDDPNVDANLVFSITLYEQGSGYYAFALYQNVDHAPGSDTSTLNFAIKAYDSDGDAVQTTLTVKVTDDVPHALSNAPLAVDEDDLSAGNHDTTSPGDDAASASLSGTLGFTAGADSPATVSFAPLGGTAVVDANGHPVTSGGVALTYFWVAGTNTLYASTDGTVGHAAFKIEVTNPSTGAYSFSLLGQIDHPGHDDPGVAGTQMAFEDNININLTYTVTDFDKDPATGTLLISIDDDMPIIGASPAPTNLILNGSFEDHGPVGNPGFNTFQAIDHWTSGPDNVPFEIQQGNIGDLLPQDGNAKVELDSDPLNNPTSQLNATIQQTIATPLAAGDSFELSFWYSPRPNDGNPDSSSLKVYWNGVVVHTIDSSTQADGWQHVSVIVTAQAGSNTVAFQGDGQPNQLGAYLDNVSLVPAITVDEDGLTGPLASGNHDSQPGDNVVPNTEGAGVDNNEATATGNLNIRWGADNLDSGVDGVSGPFNSFVQDQPNGIGDRSVTFTNANVAVTGVTALYSHGDLVTFVLNADGTVLSGVAGAGASARTVFEVSLSDEGTGQFRFVLLDKLDHAPGNNENDIGLSFNFTATDSDGDAVSGVFVVGIDDDVPVAHDDTYNLTITGPTVIAGLFGNDAFGADGVDTTNATPGQVTVTNGAHGTVVYNNDGTFTYTPNAGYSGSDKFTYTIKDGDGDVSTATVTLASVVTNTIPTAGEAFATVDDEGLPGGIDGDGQSSGDVTGHAFTASGVLPHSFVNDGPAANDPINFSLANNITGFVGTESVTYHWNDVTNTLTATSAGRGDIFKVVVDGGNDNGNGNYEFTLLKPVLHTAGDGENDATVVLNYQVVDGTTPADTATGTLTITIDDDTPITTALADTVSVNEGNLPSDRNPVEAYPVGVAQSGTGFLHINWGADNGSARHLEFAKDGNSNPIGPSLTADGVPLLYVIRAPADSSGNEQIVAYKQGDNPDTNPVFSITLYEGGNGYYTYVQYQNIDHSGLGTDLKTFGFTINAFDADGDAVSQTLTINVADDVPAAVANTNSVVEGGVLTVAAVSGVLANDIAGADGFAAGGGVVGVRAAGLLPDTTTAVVTGVAATIVGQYGTLVLQANGSYVYDGNPDVVPPTGASDVFVYTIKDGDGDLSTTTLTINLTDSGITASNDDVAVIEAALNVIGSTPASTAETVTGTVTDNVGGGIGPFTYALVGSGTGAHGTLTFNANGSYSYTLTSPVTGSQADNSTNTENNVETFTYRVTDANGNTATNTITIDVIDDVPKAVNDIYAPTITGVTVISNLLGNDTFGADGVDTGNSPVTGKVTVTNGAHGTVVYNNNGTFTYTPNVGYNGADSFTYTIKDGDGDTSTATVTLSNIHTNSVPTAGTETVLIDEEGLTNGIANGPGDIAGQVITKTGTLPFSSADGLASTDPINFSPMDSGAHSTAVVTAGNVPVTSGGVALKYYWDSVGDTLYASTDTSTLANAQSSAAFKVALNTATGAYTYTELKAVDHPGHDDTSTVGTTETSFEDNLNINITYQVKDGTTPTADTATGTLAITINDDSPVAANDIKTVVESGNNSVNLVLIIDTSGSMNDDANGAAPGTATRLDVAKAALINLLNTANVNQVLTIDFSSGANHNTEGGSVWTSKADAISYIQSLTAGGNTDYDAALKEVMDNYGSGPTPAGHNLVYFLSDGVPNEGNGTGTDGIIGAEITAWENFLNSKNIETSYGIGIGTGVGLTNLTPIGYPNSPGVEPNAFIVTNADDLANTISSGLPGSLSGNVLTNDGFGADGALGTGLVSITVDSHIYTYVTASNKIQKDGVDFAGGAGTSVLDVTTTLGGSLTFYFTTAAGHTAGDYTYDSPSNIASNQLETFGYTIADRDGDQSSANLSINVTAVNDAPVNTVPGAQSVAEDASLVFNGAKLISIADADANGGNETVTVSVAHGTLSLSGTAGLSFTTGDGIGDATMTFSGTVADINAALNGLTYKGVQDYNGSDTLTITTNDNGNTGTGGAKSDVDTIAITVTPVNDAPTAVADSFTVTELAIQNGTNGSMLNVGNVLTAGIDDSDPEGSALTVTAMSLPTIVETDAQLSITSITSISNGGDVARYEIITNTGTARISIAANGLVEMWTTAGDPFQGLGVGETATINFNYTISDGSLGDSAPVSITITGTNDAPVATANTFSVTEAEVETALLATPKLLGNLLTSGIADSDPDGDSLLTVTGITAPVLTESSSNLSLDSVAVQAAGTGEAARYRIRIDNSSPTLADQDAYVAVMTNGDVRIWSDSGEDPFRGLSASQSATITFNYTVSDGISTNSALATITINGTNDLSIITGPSTGEVTEAGGVNNGTPGTATATGNLSADDPDGTDDSWLPVAAGTNSVNGYGTFAVTAAGVWTYTVNNANPTVQGLIAGDTLTDTFTTTTADGATQVVTVTINGANDAPVVSNVVVTETAIAFDVTDPDHAAFTLVNTPVAFATTFGNPSLDDDNSLNVPAAQATVRSGTLQIQDGAGATANVIGLYLGTNTANVFDSGGSTPMAIYGFGGNDDLTGGTGADFIFGGDNDDTIRLANGDFAVGEVINGGNGNDTISLTGAVTVDFTTGTVVGVENILGNGNNNDNVTMSASQWASSTSINLAGGGNDVLNVKVDGIMNISVGATPTVTNVETGNLRGSDNNDTLTLTGGQLNAILLGSGTIDLGAGSGDTINLTSTSSDLNGLVDGSLINVEAISAAGAGAGVTINLGAQTEAITITGSSFGDIITSSTGSSTINAGAGADTVMINAGTAARNWAVDLGSDAAIDKIVFTHASIGDGHNTVATVSNFGTNDRIAITLGATAIADGAFQTVTAAQTNITGEVIELFNSAWVGSLTADGDSGIIEQFIAAATNNIATGNYTFIVYSDITASANAGIYSVNISDSTDPTIGSDIAVEHIMTLTGVGYGNLADSNFVATADPIVLDLDNNGFAFSSLENGVQFDINGDGAKDQVAWTNGHDGLLALDIDHSGKIDSGKELFTPNFNDKFFADGIAALASLDANHDGVIDSKDAAFGDLVIWRDANHNGVSDDGELTKLTDAGIASIDLTTTPGTIPIDGQNVAATGTFTYTDGSKGSFVEVDLDASHGDGSHISYGTNGADTFAVSALGAEHAETIVNYNAAEGDKLDLSALLDAVFTETSNVDNFIHLEQSGNDVKVQVDTSGQGNFGGGAHDAAILAGYGAVSHGDIVNMVFAGTEHQLNTAA